MAARLLARDPGLGASLRALAGPVRDMWLGLLRESMPPGAPWRRLPLHAGDDRLLGGLDLAATLVAGRPVAARGLLAEADGGMVLVAMAERTPIGTAAILAGVLDTGAVTVERDGLAWREPARIGVVALDEGDADERPPAALLDRVAFHLDLSTVGLREATPSPRPSPASAGEGEACLPPLSRGEGRGEGGGDALTALCRAAHALGIGSVRAPILALRAARAAAALDGREAVTEADAALAARLVLAPRATRLPAETAPEPAPESAPDTAPDEMQNSENVGEMADIVLDAARAAIPQGLLDRLRLTAGPARAAPVGAGAVRASPRRGRPIGARRGDPRSARLNLIETLRAAAPWQRLRRRPGAPWRIEVRPDDFRVTRFRERTQTTTIFVVDASGSAALNRLGEAKGAVELVLADCYVRRDRVALLAFRGAAAALLLPPTSSLVRARRSLAGLPGGGATPLAAGIDAAMTLADQVRRAGQTPIVVLLSDGRANIARDGAPGRARAQDDALSAARALAGQRVAAIVVDTSPRPTPAGRDLAAAMSARYLPLPYADSAVLGRAITGAAR